jgi:hypothetical protein
MGSGCVGIGAGFAGAVLRVCPEVFKTTIILMIVKADIIRIFLIFIIFPLLVAFNNRVKLQIEPVIRYGV